MVSNGENASYSPKTKNVFLAASSPASMWLRNQLSSSRVILPSPSSENVTTYGGTKKTIGKSSAVMVLRNSSTWKGSLDICFSLQAVHQLIKPSPFPTASYMFNSLVIPK